MYVFPDLSLEQSKEMCMQAQIYSLYNLIRYSAICRFFMYELPGYVLHLCRVFEQPKCAYSYAPTARSIESV